MSFDDYSYGSISGIYDWLAAAYSFGRIGASKRDALATISRNDRVLFAGVGRGEDALLAARQGARVTAIDLAPSMLKHVSNRFDRDGLALEAICGDVAKHEPADCYDVVVANYFLNLFEVDRARAMLRHLGSLVCPGGCLILADFARPEGGMFARLITEAYYRPANWIAWAFGYCALHPILDYAQLMTGMDYQIETSRRRPVFAGRNPAFHSTVVRRLR